MFLDFLLSVFFIDQTPNFDPHFRMRLFYIDSFFVNLQKDSSQKYNRIEKVDFAVADTG
jgi:hypothetical protein